MTTMLRKIGMPQIMFSPDEPAAAAASDAGADKAAQSNATQSSAAEKTSVLYPDDAPKQPAATDPAASDKPAATAGEAWKEYANDPAKSAEENAAAKAEHDKTKPAEAAADDAKLDTVPEDGKYQVEMPEGIELDTKLLDRFSPKFKDAGLTQRQVQAVATEFAQMRKEEAESYMGTPEGQWSAASYEYYKESGTPDSWIEKGKADKEIGGDKWDSSVSTARRAVNELGTPELKALLEATGTGNHPELIRFMAKAGAMIKEDNPATGNAPGGKKADRLEVLYPNDKPKGK